MNSNFPYKSVLIVCSVNVARSPMAEGFLRDYFKKKEIDVDVFSCGVASHARDGMLISMDARLAMKEVGIQLSDTSLSVDVKKHLELINKADMILTLTEQHKEEIVKLDGAREKDIFTLKEFAGKSGDIEDPSMKGIEGFRKSRDEIRSCLVEGLKKFEC